MKCVAIIPSGGIGSRFNSPIPKQYLKVLGKELILYTLQVFQESSFVDQIIIPAHESYIEFLHQICKDNNITKVSHIVIGGKERQDSVYNGLIAENFDNNDLIIVHDAARPLVSKQLLENAIKSAEKFNSIVVAIKARDTLIKANNTDNNVLDYTDRDSIYYAQTPQVFRYNILKHAFDYAIQSNFLATDESMLVKNAGYDVKIVEGEFNNFKITTKSDLDTFAKLITKD